MSRPPAPGAGGDASLAPETRVLYILTLITLVAAVVFALASLLLLVRFSGWGCCICAC